MSLIPIEGAFVRHHEHQMEHGIVQEVEHSGRDSMLQVRWQNPNLPSRIHPQQLRNGLVPGARVLDVPSQEYTASLGLGTVMSLRQIGEQEQVLVDFWEEQQRLWLPWQNLRPQASVKQEFLRYAAKSTQAERLRLRNLAYALEQWHGNTGALSQLSIDPLPHQIYLVHKILASGNLNWMIADDVGLGKTIEVGMLISALQQKGFQRFLIVAPAGLTNQWQEEMRDKFAIEDFRIYGQDFTINQANHWRMEDKVIASIDTLKGDTDKDKLQASGQWDMVIFDEAHRLSRDRYNHSYKASQRYQLAAQLRAQSENFLLLTATPHQGKEAKFHALLELLRPGRSWISKFNQLQQHPEILQDIIIRNRKADVTDAKGAFIFQGKKTEIVTIPMSEQEKAFDQALQEYLRQGYNASQSNQSTAKAIGFVMTTYRKLAASSIAAIHKALLNRFKKVKENKDSAVLESNDERFIENEENIQTSNKQFFAGELQMLYDLIKQAREVAKRDSKTRYFLKDIIQPILNRNPHEKVLIFTEYRTTQERLLKILGRYYGENKICKIQGGQKLAERQQAIVDFENDKQFLISTEAGGEGLNLQKNCHIMVNFDLPWNPMRLVQRVGRLYRYGQKKTVVVINMQTEDSLDNKILGLMYDRLEQIASDMASVNDEYNERLKEDVLGELVSNFEVTELLEDALHHDIERTEERLTEALQRAKQATALQDEMLKHATGFDPNALEHSLKLNEKHLKRFVAGMCSLLEITISNEQYKGDVWNLKLPEKIQEELNSKQNIRISFRNELAKRANDIEAININSTFMRFLLDKAKHPSFAGRTASIQTHSPEEGFSVSALLRWQNDRGIALHQEYINLMLSADGEVMPNSAAWSDWLLAEKSQALQQESTSNDREAKRTAFQRIEKELHRTLQQRSSYDSHPDSWLLISAADLS